MTKSILSMSDGLRFQKAANKECSCKNTCCKDHKNSDDNKSSTGGWFGKVR